MDDSHIRAINLIEILREEAQEKGCPLPDPPEHAITTWSEEDIKRYYSSHGTIKPSAESNLNDPPSTLRIPPADDETFKKWFPGLALSKTACHSPRFRLLCFPNAGNAEDMYTSEGTGTRKTPSPLLEWCRTDNRAECLAPQYPGRAMRMKEQPITTAKEMAKQLLPVVASKLYDVPWILVAHSVGTWIAFEFLHACRDVGVPMPRIAFLSGMPSPDIPEDERPWRQQGALGEDEFKKECRGWDISEVVFSAAMWPTYQPLLRADFTLFDEYVFTHGSDGVFEFPVCSFWGVKDRRVKEHHVKGWRQFTRGDFECHAIDGNHLWPLDKASKTAWLQHIARKLDEFNRSMHDM